MCVWVIEYRFLLVVITSLGRRFPVSKTEKGWHLIHACNILFRPRVFFKQKTESLKTSTEDEQHTDQHQTVIIMTTQKWKKKERRYYTVRPPFCDFMGRISFVFFFPLSKKKKKGEICCYRRISVLTMLYDRVFVCWTHGQTPGLSGHHHNGYLLSFFFFCGEEDLLVGLKVNCIGAEQRKWGTHAKPCKPSDVHTYYPRIFQRARSWFDTNQAQRSRPRRELRVYIINSYFLYHFFPTFNPLSLLCCSLKKKRKFKFFCFPFK